MRFALDLTCMLALAVSYMTLRAAAAQEAQPTEQAPVSAPAPPQQSLFNEIGKLLKGPADLLPSFSKSDAPAPPAPEADAPASPPPAVTGSKGPPPETKKESTRSFPGMVTGRELCPVGANGAPDCQTGSDRLCQSKGYQSGKSLNTDSTFSCSARVARAAGKACGNEHFVTSAFCN